MLHYLPCPTKPQHWLSEDDIAEVMRQYDTNGDGVIRYGLQMRRGRGGRGVSLRPYDTNGNGVFRHEWRGWR